MKSPKDWYHAKAFYSWEHKAAIITEEDNGSESAWILNSDKNEFYEALPTALLRAYIKGEAKQMSRDDFVEHFLTKLPPR